MKKRICAIFIGALMLGFGSLNAEMSSENDAQENFKKDFKSCTSFLQDYCGGTPWEDCVQKPDKKSHQVAQCVQFMMKNQQSIKEKEQSELAPTFQTLLKDVKSGVRDSAECIKIANTICGDGQGFNECLEKNAGSFPSYCRAAVKDSLNKMEAAYDNDVELKSCADVLVGKCDKLLKEENNVDLTDAQERAMYAGYQACLKTTLPKLRACQGLINADQKSKKAPGVQKIDYR